MKRLTIVLILLLLSLTGCGSEPVPVIVHSPPVITLWHSYQGDAAAGLEQARAELAKSNPGFDLQLLYVPADSYWTKLTQAMAAGKGPDIFIAPQDKLPTLYREGSIRPVNNFLDSRKYLASAIQALSISGNILAVPRTIRVPLLASNLDMVPGPPQSFEQLRDMAYKATRGKTVGLAGDITNPFLTGQVYTAYGGKLVGPDQKPCLDSPENQDYLQAVGDSAVLQVAAYDPGASRDLVAGATTPFALLDSSELGAYTGLGMNLGFGGIPGPGGVEGKPYVRADGFALASNCNFPQQAAAAASYLASAQALAKYSIPLGEFPAQPDAYDQSPLKENSQAQTVRHLAQIGVGYPLDNGGVQLLSIFSQAVKDVLDGKLPAAAAQDAQSGALSALGYGKR